MFLSSKWFAELKKKKQLTLLAAWGADKAGLSENSQSENFRSLPLIVTKLSAYSLIFHSWSILELEVHSTSSSYFIDKKLYPEVFRDLPNRCSS